MIVYQVPHGANIYGGRFSSSSLPFTVEPGECKTVSYAAGTHPLGGGAVLEEISPKYQSWNPNGSANDGPWGGLDHIYGFNGIMAYCGGAMDTDNSRYLFVGAGHAAINIPVPFSFDFRDLRWKWLDIPPPSDGLYYIRHNALSVSTANLQTYYPGPTDDSAFTASDQLSTKWGDWNGGWSGWPSGYERPGKIFPECNHSTSNLCFIPASAYGGSGALAKFASGTGSMGGVEPGETVSKTSHLFDMTAGAWQRTANQRPNGAGSSCGGTSVDLVRGKIYSINYESSSWVTHVAIFDAATKTFQTLSTSSNVLPDLSVEGGGINVHAPSDLLLAFASSTSPSNFSSAGTMFRVFAIKLADLNAGTWSWYELNVSAASWPVRTSSGPDGGNGTVVSVGWESCPLNGCLYATNGSTGSTTLWKLSPPAGASTQADYLSGTWTVATEAFTGETLYSKSQSRVTPWSSWVGNRLKWLPAANCFAWMSDDYLGPVQVIRPIGV